MKEEIGRLIDRLKALNEEQTKVTEKLKELRETISCEDQPTPNTRTAKPSSALISPKAKSRFGPNYRTDISGTEYTDETCPNKFRFGHSYYTDISGTAYNDENFPREDDIVRIINPNRNQAKLGRIIGFCKDGGIKIDTHQDKTIIRAMKNVVLIDREDEASSYY